MYILRFRDHEGNLIQVEVDDLTIWRSDAGFNSEAYVGDLRLLQAGNQIIGYDERGITSISTINE